MLSIPPATTAIVPVGRAFKCATPSIPRAKPEMTTLPAWPSSLANKAVIFLPVAEALRAPTIPKPFLCNRFLSPIAHNTGGGEGIALRPAG